MAKLGIVEEEADETLLWLELLVEAEFMPSRLLKPLMKEVDEILAMVVASIKTLRSNTRRDGFARASANPKSKIQNPKLE